MSITTPQEREGIQKISDAVAVTLKKMREFARPGMTTKALDDYGRNLLETLGAKSAPFLTYKFPGYTCISLNHEIAHGIPSDRVIREGDLINIDVSAELNGFWSDNGGSFVLGEDTQGHSKLVNTSKYILQSAIGQIKGGVKISDIGKLIESLAKKNGYKVIRNLTGHGVGRSLHEAPHEIANYYDKFNQTRFRKNSVVAIETFISTQSSYAETMEDGWTLVGDKGGYVVQHEHTILITDGKPIILTAKNDIYNN